MEPASAEGGPAAAHGLLRSEDFHVPAQAALAGSAVLPWPLGGWTVKAATASGDERPIDAGVGRRPEDRDRRGVAAAQGRDREQAQRRRPDRGARARPEREELQQPLGQRGGWLGGQVHRNVGRQVLVDLVGKGQGRASPLGVDQGHRGPVIADQEVEVAERDGGALALELGDQFARHERGREVRPGRRLQHVGSRHDRQGVAARRAPVAAGCPQEVHAGRGRAELGQDGARGAAGQTLAQLCGAVRGQQGDERGGQGARHRFGHVDVARRGGKPEVVDVGGRLDRSGPGQAIDLERVEDAQGQRGVRMVVGERLPAGGELDRQHLSAAAEAAGDPPGLAVDVQSNPRRMTLARSLRRASRNWLYSIRCQS